ncbi:MAG: TIM barrel protein [Bryobacteraceae bacterium]|nr:TIM barrel protein [Bryobacteraceae bacterium]
MQRRTFLATAAAAAAAPASTSAAIKPGIDLFSLRQQQGWDAFQFLDYCAKQKAKVVHFSEIKFLGSLDDAHMKKVRTRAEELGIELEIGMRSICPTSKAFDPAQGTAEEQLGRVIRAANIAGSKLVRCFLGTMNDRLGDTPIEAHIENTVKTLRANRSRAMDAGIKIAVENHAGDMQARELKTLIEAAGKDFVGACIDSGNPVWAIEDPHLTLEVLAPYVLTSHVRDSLLWRTPEGVAVKWVRMGDGNVNIGDWVRKYQQLCPGKALSMEIIVIPHRTYAWQDPKFWNAYRNTPAWEFARFMNYAEKGSAPPAVPPVPREEAPARERQDLEASIAWTEKILAS